MKDMKDFKGTKGEFEAVKTSDRFEILQKDSGLPTLACVIPYDDEEGEANARLFANSKKVLEVAIEVMRFSSSLKVIADEKLQFLTTAYQHLTTSKKL